MTVIKINHNQNMHVIVQKIISVSLVQQIELSIIIELKVNLIS
jgi:hypothetical protein